MKIIETERFNLRVVTENDVKHIFNILSDKEVLTYLNMDLHTSIKDTENLIKKTRILSNG